MTTKLAIIISDVHYSLHTLPLADNVMRQALSKANDLNIPLIVAGDLHDTKANLRAECIEDMLNLFGQAFVPVYVLVGNHDLINEKSTTNALEFLRGIVNLVKHPTYACGFHLLPYYSDTDLLKARLKTIPKGSTIIMHQGVKSANSGEYAHDKSAIEADLFDGYRVISGHYHARQDIKCGETGLFSYVGNPFTLTFGEANDPEKGFRILNSDGTLDFIPTNLRKHIIYDIDLSAITEVQKPDSEDLVWVKLTGTKEQLAKITRRNLDTMLGFTSYKLSTFPLDTETEAKVSVQATQSETLDEVIDLTYNVSEDQKTRLKALWRSLNEKT